MPPKPRRKSSARSRSSPAELARAKSAPPAANGNGREWSVGRELEPEPEPEPHPRAAALAMLGDIERQRLCRALEIEPAGQQERALTALTARIAELERMPVRELREMALHTGVEEAALVAALEGAVDRKTAVLDLLLDAGQRARPPARRPPARPIATPAEEGVPPASATPMPLQPAAARGEPADDEHEHTAALMAWYRAYDPAKANAQHVARVIRMFKKRERRLAAKGDAKADWRLMMHATFEEHNQVDPRDLMMQPVEPQSQLELSPLPRPDSRPEPEQRPPPPHPERQPEEGVPEPKRSERSEPEPEPPKQPEQPAAIAGGAEPGPQDEAATATGGSQQLPLTTQTTEAAAATESSSVLLVSPEELCGLSGRWLAQGESRRIGSGPEVDEVLLLSVSAGGVITGCIEEDNCTIRNGQIDPATGWCELEQVYEDGALTRWRCRYDPSTRTLVQGEWSGESGELIGKFTAAPQPQPPAAKPPEATAAAAPAPAPPARTEGGINPPQFVTQRKQRPKQQQQGQELSPRGEGDAVEHIEWQLGRELGKGHFATAFEMTKLKDGSRWAAKVVSKASLRDFKGRQQRFEEELAIHASLVMDGARAKTAPPHLCLSRLLLLGAKSDHLPRQVRDQHTENLKEERSFCFALHRWSAPPQRAVHGELVRG